MSINLRKHLLKEAINPKERKQITQMIVNGKGSVKVGDNKVSLKNKEMTFNKDDALFISIVEILDTLGYSFEKTKKGMTIK